MVFSAAAILGAASAQADSVTLYSNNFEGGSTADFSGAGGYTPTIVTAPNASTSFLGNLSTGQTTAVLTLDTAGLSSVRLGYSLYSILSQDGDGPAGGNSPSNPDSFVVTSGGTTLSDYSFANYGGNTQSYGGPGVPMGEYAPQTGAVAVDTLGYGVHNGFDDATYAFSYTFVPTGNTTQIAFTSNDNEGVGNEFYGIDNVSVTGVTSTISAAPEPSTWLLMIAGIAGIGLMLRQAKSKIGSRLNTGFTI
jgi:hypothetical protein